MKDYIKTTEIYSRYIDMFIQDGIGKVLDFMHDHDIEKVKREYTCKDNKTKSKYSIKVEIYEEELV